MIKMQFILRQIVTSTSFSLPSLSTYKIALFKTSAERGGEIKKMGIRYVNRDASSAFMEYNTDQESGRTRSKVKWVKVNILEKLATPTLLMDVGKFTCTITSERCGKKFH